MIALIILALGIVIGGAAVVVALYDDLSCCSYCGRKLDYYHGDSDMCARGQGCCEDMR